MMTFTALSNSQQSSIRECVSRAGASIRLHCDDLDCPEDYFTVDEIARRVINEAVYLYADSRGAVTQTEMSAIQEYVESQVG